MSCGAGSDVYSRRGYEPRGGQRHAAEVLLVSCGAGSVILSGQRSVAGMQPRRGCELLGAQHCSDVHSRGSAVSCGAGSDMQLRCCW